MVAAEFRILGPVEIVMDMRRVPLGGPRQRAVLGMLLVHRNEVVSADRLVDAVWGANPPATVAKALQMQISSLRKAIGGDRIETLGAGYVLRLDDGELDADSFESIVASASSRVLEERSVMLRDALALWRGPPLDDFTYEAFATSEIRRLNERKLAVIEDLVDVELKLGRHAELVSELEGLVEEEPLRERLSEQLMLSLYRSGRQADALAVGRRTRQLLADQFGIEPSRSLRELERAMLNQDTSLDPPPVEGHRRATAGRGALIGRDAELAVLLDALDDAIACRGRLVLVGGEPGIGKSRLVEEFAAEAEVLGARALVGRCWEVGGAPAYWPWVQSLRSYIRELSPEAVRVEMGSGAQDLVQMLPELHDLIPALEPASTDPEGARFRLFDSTSTFLRNAAKEQPLVLVLEDVHAADEPSLLLLRFLARNLSSSRLLLVAAYRTVDPTLSAPLSEALAELTCEPATTTLSLDGLDANDVSQLIEQTTSEAPSPLLAAALRADTNGNPLFVAEIARLLAAEGRLADAELASHHAIPASIQVVIGQRLRRLSSECNRVLVLAAVLGREFRLDALERVAQLDRNGLIDVLDEALTARVLIELPSSTESMRFGHALVRDVVYGSISGPRRTILHRQVGEALRALYESEPESHLAELAHHFYLAASDGDSEGAVQYCSLAGQRATDLLAYEEAARHYVMALELLDRSDAVGAAERCDLLLALGDARARAGDAPASKEAFREAANLARSNDLPELFGQAALGYGGRMVWEVSRDDEQLLPLLEGALAALGDADTALRARLLARLAGGPLRDSRFPRERREALGDEALQIARRLGDVATLAYALGGHMASHHGPDFTTTQAALSAELVDLAVSVGDKERAMEGLELRLAALLELGDMPGAVAALEHMEALARELRQPSQMWYVAAYRGVVLLLEGRLVETEQLIEEALRLGERSQNWSATVSYRLQLYLLRREQGRLVEVRNMVSRSADEYSTYPIWRCVLVQTMADLGPDGDARELLTALVADDLVALPFDEEWLVSLGLLSEAAHTLDDADVAGAIYPRLLPYADRVAVAYPEISTGSVSRYLGLLATTLKQWDAAAGHFAAAIAVNGRIGARPWRAYAQLDLARMLLKRGQVRDRAAAKQLAEDAAQAGSELGIDALAAAATLV